MPAQERVRRDEERAPTLARDEPAGSGQERSVPRPKRGASNLAPKKRELVAKHHDLKLLELLGAAAEHDKPDQTLQSDVEERSEQAQPPAERMKARDSMDASC